MINRSYCMFFMAVVHCLYRLDTSSQGKIDREKKLRNREIGRLNGRSHLSGCRRFLSREVGKTGSFRARKSWNSSLNWNQPLLGE